MASKNLERELKELDRLKERGVITEDEYQNRRSALVSAVSSGEAQGSRRGGIMKWGLMGCLGIFAVIGILFIILIIAIAAAVGGGSDKADDGSDVRVALAAGAKGTISPEGNGSKKSQVTLLQVVDDAKSTNQFSQPGAGNKFIAFEVEHEDVGSQEVSSLDWKLRDSADGEHGRTFVSGVGENLEVAYNLTPGGKQRGWVVFEVPSGVSVKWLRADPNPFLSNDLYFDGN